MCITGSFDGGIYMGSSVANSTQVWNRQIKDSDEAGIGRIACTHAHTHTPTHTPTRTHTHTHTHTHTYTNVYTCIHTLTHTYTHIHTLTYRRDRTVWRHLAVAKGAWHWAASQGGGNGVDNRSHAARIAGLLSISLAPPCPIWSSLYTPLESFFSSSRSCPLAHSASTFVLSRTK